MEKVAAATTGEFQISSDALGSYPESVEYHFGDRISYGQIIKNYGEAPKEERRKYSPARIIGVERRAISGNPDADKICTSIVERTNLSIRTHVKRFNRLTCCFSKKLANHKAAFALFAMHFNFCRFHRTLRMTPAMKAGVAAKPWSLLDLVAA